MLGRHTLLVNPPLINGVAFTRQGRCQEREDVLGTTKPPYTLALLAALLRNAGHDVRLIDATAERIDVEEVAQRLDADGFTPTLILFPTTTPTLDADVAAMTALKARYRAPLFSSVRTRPRRRPNRWPARAAWTGCSAASRRTASSNSPGSTRSTGSATSPT